LLQPVRKNEGKYYERSLILVVIDWLRRQVPLIQACLAVSVTTWIWGKQEMWRVKEPKFRVSHYLIILFF